MKLSEYEIECSCLSKQELEHVSVDRAMLIPDEGHSFLREVTVYCIKQDQVENIFKYDNLRLLPFARYGKGINEESKTAVKKANQDKFDYILDIIKRSKLGSLYLSRGYTLALGDIRITDCIFYNCNESNK